MMNSDGFSTAAKQIESERRGAKPREPDNSQQLRSIVDRIIRLTEEKKGLAADIKDLFAEARSNGYPPKSLRIVIKRMLEDSKARAGREEDEMIAETMLAALGEFVNTPLGSAAMAGRAN